jgi:hypothetical protein
VDPVPDPLLLRKSGSAGNRTMTSRSVATRPEFLTLRVHKPSDSEVSGYLSGKRSPGCNWIQGVVSN